MKKGDYYSKGFTIIEVALVLAIGGLIFMMVFIALPGLRASQRDAERRENVSYFLQQVKNYQSSNRGALPKDTDYNTSFKQKYFTKVDPSGENYQITVLTCDKSSGVECTHTELTKIKNAKFPNNYKLIVVKQASCAGDKAVGTNNPRKIAVLYKLEGAGVYCANT